MQKMTKIALSSLAVLAFVGLVLFFGGDMCADDSYADPVGGDCSAAGDGNNVTWSFDDSNNSITIAGNGAMADYTSETIGDRPWATYIRMITHVSIGAGVTHIGDYAFYGLSAYYPVNGGLDIAEGSNLTSIGAHAFDGSNRARDWWNDGGFIREEATNPIPNGVVEIGEYAFYCTDLEDVIIPASVKTVGAYAFACPYNVSRTISVEINADLDTVGDYAFTKVTKLTINGKIPVNIGNSSFSPNSGNLAITTLEPMEPADIAKISVSAYNCVVLMPAGEVTVTGPALEEGAKINLAWQPYNLPWGREVISKITFINVGTIGNKPVADVALNYTGYGSGNSAQTIDSLIIDGVEVLSVDGVTGFRLITDSEGKAKIYSIPADKTVLSADDFPESVTDFTFGFDNSTVSSMTIPSRATNVSFTASFSRLTYLKIDAPITALTLSRNTGNLREVDLSATQLTSLSAGISSLETVKLPATLTKLSGTFANCSSLKSVNTENVTELGSQTFWNCTALESVDLSGLKKIDGQMIFRGCTSLRELDVSGVEISDNTSELVAGCTSLTSIKMPAGYTKIGSWMFNQTAIKTYDFSGVESIAIGAFYGCSSLGTVDLHSVKTIGPQVFYGCTSLTSVDISSATTVGSQAFQGCNMLREIVLGDSCEIIGDNAFYQCASLTSITIPKGMTLTSNPFSGAPLTDISLADGYEGGNSIVDGMLLSDDGKTLVIAPSNRLLVIPDSVTNIGAFAISGNVEYVVMDCENVNALGDNSFSQADILKVVYLKNSDSLTSVSWGAFGWRQNVKIYYDGDNNPGDIYWFSNSEQVWGYPGEFCIAFETFGGEYIDEVFYDIYLTEDLECPTPVKAGSVFCGWFEDENYKTPAPAVIKKGLIGTLVLYAKWAMPSDFVSGADVIAFSGPTAVIKIDSASVPSGDIIVRYSEYIDIAEGTILFPFLTGTVSVNAGNDTVPFTNSDGKSIESCSVTFRYMIGTVAFYTPLSYANAPATSAKLDLAADDGLTVSFDGNPVINGAAVDFGLYEVSVSGGQTVVINGVVWTNGNKMFYGGQKLVVSKQA